LEPLLVSISPPKPSRVMISPTAGLLAEPLALPTTSAAFSLTFSLVSGAILAALLGFLPVGAGGGAGALRLRSSIGMMDAGALAQARDLQAYK
jgi:hypothetical protein